MLFTPFNPALEMFRLYLIAVYHFTLKISVDFVQVQTVCTRNIRSGFQNVGTQFIYIASFARIITGCLNTSAQCTCLHFKSRYIISLPAMK